MNNQLSRGACFGAVVASMFVFTLIAGRLSSRAAADFLGVYIAYLLFQLIFFYIFRAVYKNKDRGWATLLAFIGFAAIPALLGVATRYATPPTGALAPVSAFVVFIGGWWVYFSARKSSPVANGSGNQNT